MWTFTFMMFFMMMIIGVISGLTPLLGRQSTPFGVGVSGKHSFIEERKKKFATLNIVISILLGLPLFIFPNLEYSDNIDKWASIYVVFAMTGFLVFTFILYLKYRKDVLKWRESLPEEQVKTKKKVVIDMNYHQKLSTRSNFSFFIWQFAIILITFALSLIFYEHIPNEIPINWGSNFEVNRTIEKSLWGILALPIIQVLMIPVFIYSHQAIIRSKQKLSPLDPEGASEASRRFRKGWSNFLFYTTILTQLLISGLTLFSFFGENLPTWLLIAGIVVYLIIMLGGTMFLTFKYGQAGEKLLAEEQYYMDPEEDDKWLLGMIYYNSDDSSLFVEKRFGVGTTINMGNRKAWLIVAGLLLFIILTIVWTAFLT